MIMEMWELWIYVRWTHIPEWRDANNVGSKSFLKKLKTQLDTSLNKAQHKQELVCENYLALVGMCMSLRNLSIFIEL
jgi:hypothetical protein